MLEQMTRNTMRKNVTNKIQSRMITKENLRRKNFKPDDFFVSNTTYRLNHDANPNNDIVNYPPASIEQGILPCLMSTADLMQQVRDLLGVPVNLHCAYRCPKLNELVKGARNSQHMQGLAADFTAPKFGDPEKIVRFLHAEGVVVDQCFIEDTWIHISRLLQKDAKNRMMYGFYLFNPKLNKREFIAL